MVFHAPAPFREEKGFSMRRLVCAALLLVFLTACGAAGPEAIPHADQEEPPADLSGVTLRILSGSENQELEEILAFGSR